MVSVLAVGLDGRAIPADELAAELAPEDGDVIVSDDIALFDQLPKWARDALREVPRVASVKVREILPYIQTGEVNRFNIADMLRQNDMRAREYFARKDRADGIA